MLRVELFAPPIFNNLVTLHRLFLVQLNPATTADEGPINSIFFQEISVIVTKGNKNKLCKFCEKVASNVASIEPQALPPTSAAMKYHSYRVYYQICVWSEWDSNMFPEDWGWRIDEEGFVPVATDLPVAPENLSRVV